MGDHYPGSSAWVYLFSVETLNQKCYKTLGEFFPCEFAGLAWLHPSHPALWQQSRSGGF